MRKHGVMKRGSFDEHGMPCDWWIDMNLINDGKDKNIPVLSVLENGDVLLRGEFSETLTAERKLRMTPNAE